MIWKIPRYSAEIQAPLIDRDSVSAFSYSSMGIRWEIQITYLSTLDKFGMSMILRHLWNYTLAFATGLVGMQKSYLPGVLIWNFCFLTYCEITYKRSYTTWFIKILIQRISFNPLIWLWRETHSTLDTLFQATPRLDIYNFIDKWKPQYPPYVFTAYTLLYTSVTFVSSIIYSPLYVTL